MNWKQQITTKHFVLLLFVFLAGSVIAITGCGSSNPSPAKQPASKEEPKDNSGMNEKSTTDRSSDQASEQATTSDRPKLIYYVMPG